MVEIYLKIQCHSTVSFVRVVATKTVTQSCSVRKVFLKILQNSQESTCTRASFLIMLQASGPWRKCFPVNFAKFSRTPFCTEHLRWLSL